MSSDSQDTHWVQQLKKGGPDAPQELWRRYFARLVGLARQRLRGSLRRAADEEDVALSAFDSFCRRAEQGQFPRLEDRHDLWQLLVMITARKAADLVNHDNRLKRGGGAAAEGDDGLSAVISREPDPAFAAQVADTCRALLGSLGDDTLRAIAVAKMEGDTNEEIARRLAVSVATVERKLRGIRQILETGSAG
jgi:DNA-directed RNA polymerase specialized sigma24 family protein